jgi:hypothetical protein
MNTELAFLSVRILLSNYEYNLIPELLNTSRSCNRDGPATAWLTLERPVKVMPFPKIPTLFGAWEHCFSQ